MTESAEHVHNQEAIWDYYQNEGIASFDGAHSRLEYLARQLKPGATVLNIGVGNGLFEAEAQRRGLVIYSLDPSQAAIDALRARLNLGDRAQVGYSQQMPFPDAHFDAVVASEVLEHLDDATLTASLPEIKRVLKPGGSFLGTVPAREDLADQMVVCPCCAKRFHRWGHHQSFTVESLRNRLAAVFRIDTIREVYFSPWNTLNWKGRLICGLKSLLLAVGVHGSEEKIYFRATKS